MSMSEHNFEIANTSIAERVAGRLSIPLDINVWNFLARDVSDEATKVKALLRGLVADGKVFCPLSFSVITELFKQNYESALRSGTLMEELSLNTSFALDKEIYSKEARNFLQRFVDGKQVGLAKSDVYVPALAFVGSPGSLLFPAEFPAPEEEREAATQELAARIASMKFTELIHKFGSTLPLPLFQHLPTPEYSEVWEERWEYAKGNKEKMRQVEQDHYVRQILIPELQRESAKLPADARQRFAEYLKSLPQNKPGRAAGEILEHMPALKNAVEILTITGENPKRKGTMNDFFDIQMMVTPLAYADALVAPDKWIRHLLTTQRSVFDVAGARYIPSLSDFETYLKSI